jgi:glycosyltransferase involved in cell wall biosynthesis
MTEPEADRAAAAPTAAASMADDPAGARPKVLIIGPVPPPAFGVAKATKLMLDSPVLAERLDVLHLDTSDRRGVSNIGLLDWRNTFLGVRHVWQLLRLLDRNRPQVTLLTASQGKFGLMRDVLFVWAARGFGSKVVTYLRGSRYAETRANEGMFAAVALRSIFKSSARIIVLGESLVTMAKAVWPKARVAAVPNGCPVAVPENQVGVRDPDHPVLLYIGRLGTAKGIEDALRVAGKVAPVVPGLEFVLCGGWETPAFQAEMTRLTGDLGLSGAVRFPGPTTGKEKEDLLARAWALVLPSHSEGHPWVILEAMSAGVPVVATDTGAIAETVEDGVSGFVIPIGDVDALALRVTALLQDEGLWKRMSEASVRRHRERFTVEQSHTALAEELCRVAGER